MGTLPSFARERYHSSTSGPNAARSESRQGAVALERLFFLFEAERDRREPAFADFPVLGLRGFFSLPKGFVICRPGRLDVSDPSAAPSAAVARTLPFFSCCTLRPVF
jgi:hypothetical protein